MDNKFWVVILMKLQLNHFLGKQKSKRLAEKCYYRCFQRNSQKILESASFASNKNNLCLVHV